MACRPGGTISLPGVFINIVPVAMGAFVGKGLTLKTGQTHVQKYLEPLMELIEEGKIDPSFLITHRVVAGRWAGGLQDLPRQEGWLHQGGDEAQRLIHIMPPLSVSHSGQRHQGGN